MSHNSASGADPTVIDLERRLRACLKEREIDWQEWLNRENQLKQRHEQTQHTLNDNARMIEQLGLEATTLKHEVARLGDIDTRLRQTTARVAQLESQAAGYREEIEHLLDEQSAATAELVSLRQREQSLQQQVGQLTASIEQAERQLAALGEPNRFITEGLHQLLRARAELELALSPGIQRHLAQPAALSLEILYNIVRLQRGAAFSALILSQPLQQALEEQRMRGG